MSHLSPTTLTTDEQRLILRATAGNLRDPTIISFADRLRPLGTANIEGRKEFVRAFIGGITVRPDTGVLDLQMKKLPAFAAGNFTCDVW